MYIQCMFKYYVFKQPKRRSGRIRKQKEIKEALTVNKEHESQVNKEDELQMTKEDDSQVDGKEISDHGSLGDKSDNPSLGKKDSVNLRQS